MIQANEIFGINPIVAMPFDNEGRVDLTSFKQLVTHLLKTGCHGITLFGIASEFYKLSDAEKHQLAQVFCNLTADTSVYSCISVTQHSTTLAVQQARQYQEMGADSLMLLPPFFLNPSNEQVIHHIQSVLQAVDIPVLVQYAPNETGVPITAEQMTLITEGNDNAVFKIECNPPVDYTRALLSFKPDAVVMNGYAGLYMLEMLNNGGKGVMPGCSFVEVYLAIYEHWVVGDFVRAKELHDQLMPYISKWMSHCEYIIAVEKMILRRRGIILSDHCRHPDFALSNEDRDDIERFLIQFDSYLTKR